MNKIFVVYLLVALGTLTSCGKSKQQLAEEAKQREAAAAMEAKQREAIVEMEAARRKAEEDRLQAEAEKKQRNEKMNKYREQLVGNLKDPSSAQFKNLRLVTGAGGEALCGEINAKNSYGGYVGFYRFAVTEHKLKNASSNVIVLNPNEEWLFVKANQIRIGEAGCAP